MPKSLELGIFLLRARELLGFGVFGFWIRVFEFGALGLGCTLNSPTAETETSSTPSPWQLPSHATLALLIIHGAHELDPLRNLW